MFLKKSYKKANDREKLIGQNEYDLIVNNMITIADKNNIKKNNFR